MRVVSLALAPEPDASDMGDLERLETQLIAEFSPPLRPDEVRRRLLECVASYRSAVVRTYLPMLIERGTRERLRELVASRQAQPHRGHFSRTVPINRTYSAQGVITRDDREPRCRAAHRSE